MIINVYGSGGLERGVAVRRSVFDLQLFKFMYWSLLGQDSEPWFAPVESM